MSRREGPAARPALQDAAWLPRVGPTAPRAGAAVRWAPRPGGRAQAPSFAMGHNNSWVSPNTSHPRNTSGAEAGANRSALGELSEAHLYRQFTITVQVVIFIGSLLGFQRPRSMWEYIPCTAVLQNLKHFLSALYLEKCPNNLE